MRAYKCDRCGALFVRDFKPRYEVIKSEVGYCLDLCEICTWSLNDWMTSNKQARVFTMCNECVYSDKCSNEEPCKTCCHSHVDHFVYNKEADK